jgi:hypothetical protein
VAVASEARRLRVENGALTRLRTTERAAAEELAGACRARAVQLQAEVVSAGRLSTWRAVGILVAGIALGLVPGYLAGQFAATGR